MKVNVPPRIGGQPVADRLSFHFRSAYYFGGGRYRCDDMRAGCAEVAAGARLVLVAARDRLGCSAAGRDEVSWLSQAAGSSADRTTSVHARRWRGWLARDTAGSRSSGTR